MGRPEAGAPARVGIREHQCQGNLRKVKTQTPVLKLPIYAALAYPLLLQPFPLWTFVLGECSGSNSSRAWDTMTCAVSRWYLLNCLVGLEIQGLCS